MAKHGSIGVPRRTFKPSKPKKPPKSPVDTFFDAVQGPPGTRGPVGPRSSKPPKPPHAPPGVRGPSVPKAKPKKTAAAPKQQTYGQANVRTAAPQPPTKPHTQFSSGKISNTVGRKPKHLRRMPPGLPNPEPSFGGAVRNLSSNVVGDNITNLVTHRGHVTPWMLPIEAAGIIIPGLRGTGRLAETAVEGGRALRAGEGLTAAGRRVGKTLKEGYNPARREIVVPHPGGATVVHGPASRGLALRGIQRGLDKATQAKYQKAGQYGDVPWWARKNVSNMVKTREFYTNEVERATAKTLQHARLSPEKKMALKMTAHETPPDVWIKNNLAIIAKKGTSKKTIQKLRAENDLVSRARKYVRVVDAKDAGEKFPTRLEPGQQTVVLEGRAPRDLHHAWAELLGVGGHRAAMAKELGKITDTAEEARLSAPGRVRRGARWDAEQGKLVGAEDFKGGRVYEPSTRGGKRLPIGQHRTVGDILPAKVLGGSEFRHPYKGTLPLLGQESHDITRHVGEAGLGMQRLYSGTKKLEHLKASAAAGTDLPADTVLKNRLGQYKSWQPIRLGQLSDETRAELHKAIGKINDGETLTASEHVTTNKALAKAYEDTVIHSLGDINGEQVGFVRKELVGNHGQYDPFTRFDKIWGSISDPIKKAIVYTKVGHVGPRLASNLFFNLSHMGVHLVPTAAKTFILSKMDPEMMRWVDQVMGHGSYAALGEGLNFSRTTEKYLVRPVQAIADLMPRRFAFIEEVEQATGKRFTNMHEALDELRRLRDAPAGSLDHERLVNITQRARVHAGEYQRMSNFEKRKVSKFLFLYAWHRTAAVSLGKFALEHPAQAAALGYGLNYWVGDVNKNAKPWEKFSIPLGGGNISNLATSMPFSTPVEDVRTALATGKAALGLHAPVLGEMASGDLNPTLVALIESLSGRELDTGNPLPRGGVPVSLAQQTPIGAAVSGKRPGIQRWGKYLVGNPYPALSSEALSANTRGGGGSLNLPPLSTRPGSITKAQHSQILKLMHAREKQIRRQQRQRARRHKR